VPDGLHASEVISIDDAETIRAASGDLLRAVRGVHRTAADVHTDWLHLVWSYEAPEQQQVWDAMRPPSQKALELSDNASLVDAALGRYADRMAELDVERRALVADIIVLNDAIAEVSANDESNRWYNNVADWAQQEDIGLLHAEQRLSGRMANLRANKEIAEIQCGNEIGAIWGAPTYHLYDQGDVKSPYAYGASSHAYENAVGTSTAPWSGPSMRMDGDWTTKVEQFDQGANDEVANGVIYVADLAGLASHGRTEFARSGLQQMGTDAWAVAAPFVTGEDAGPGYRDSLVRTVDVAKGSVGYGTWATNGWHTAGSFAPGLGAALATRGMAAPPLVVLRGGMATRHLGLPPGMRLHPSLVIPAIQLRTSQAFATSKTRLANAIDTSLSQLDGAFGKPALARPAAHPQIPIVQTPPSSLGVLHNTSHNEGARRPPKDSRALTLRSRAASERFIEIPELKWEKNYDLDKLRSSHPEVIVELTLPAIEKVRTVEPKATADFLSALPETARPHGLEHRVKSPDSLASKVERKIDVPPSPKAVAQMNDLVRYTSVVPNNTDLIPSVRSVVQGMKGEGWTVVTAQHSYVDNNPYKGIHCTMRSEDLDVSVELQFHTEKSQAIKDDTHELYELFRDPRTSAFEKANADAELREKSADIDHPSGIDDFVALDGVDVNRLEYRSDRK